MPWQQYSVAVVALLAAGCGGAGSTAARSGDDLLAGVPACEAVVAEGKPVPASLTDTGCRTGDTINGIAGFDCANGSKLIQFTYKGVDYWGFTGSTWKKSTADAATNPAYKAAYDHCNS
jgi:hypothetical protein